jgi:hypothetical protein
MSVASDARLAAKLVDPATLYDARAVSFPAELTELYQGA